MVDQAMIELVAAAIDRTDVGFNMKLTRLVDGVHTYELKMDGKVEEFDNADDLYIRVREIKQRKQAEAVIAALSPAPAEHVMGSEPVAEIVEATSPAAELIFGRDIKFFEALRTLPIGTKLYAVPLSFGGDSHQRILGILDDFAEMQPEEDEDWESWYHASFDLARQKIRAALSSPMGGVE